jgi:hypothetical protein
VVLLALVLLLLLLGRVVLPFSVCAWCFGGRTTKIHNTTQHMPTHTKQALESDTRVLAYEAGRKYSVRVNTISAGPLGSRAAKVRARGGVGGVAGFTRPIFLDLSAQPILSTPSLP